MALAIYSVVLLSVVVVSNLFFKISEQLKISMLLDEEIVKLHTSIQSIVSRQWTLMATITDITDPEALSGNSITLISSIPANNQTGWVTAVSTITHDPVRKELLYLLPKDESGEIITTSVSKYLDSFSVSLIPGTDYIKYDATFCYYDPNVEQPIMQRRVEGAVRFY
ncbi:hypothetical protein [Kosmotoga pacifica]|uniref:hypothetical protein n=1 Tax=Kosmotoga pacifica TaxID=1330330 RepID=UPI0012E059A4|nr:hypothetical protein [Kosmotoga pacifica]